MLFQVGEIGSHAKFKRNVQNYSSACFICVCVWNLFFTLGGRKDINWRV